VKDLLKQLPSYLPDFVSLVTGPKTAIRRWIEAAQDDLTHPIIFVSVSVAIGFLMQLPQIGKDADFSTLVAGMVVFKILALFLIAAVIHFLFRVVRGQASFAATLSAYLYTVSPLYLVFVVIETATLGMLRAYDPAVSAAERLKPLHLYADMEQMDAFTAAAPEVALSYGLLHLLRIIVFFGWFTVCWGAFRHIHAVPRWRSILVGIAAFYAGLGVFMGLDYILIGMFGTEMPALR